MNLATFIPVLPEIWMAVLAMFILVTCTGSQSSVSDAKYYAFFGLGLTLIAQMAVSNYASNIPLLNIDYFSQFTGFIVVLTAMLVVMISSDFFKRQKSHKGEFYVLIILSTLGMRIMLASNNMLSLYVGLEMMSFSLYILASFLRDNPKSAEAGLKYFVLGSLSSAILLYGISMLYGVSGSLEFADISAQIATLMEHANHSNPTLIIGLVFVLAGLLFKVSAVPFHMWTPDVYEGSPSPVTMFMATAPKVAAVAILIKVLFYPLIMLQTYWQPALFVISAFTMFAGSIFAIMQTDIKRLIAYSSITHVGFLMTGLVSATQAGVTAALFYLVAYVVTSLGVFAVILQLKNRSADVETVDDLKGIAERFPILALILLVCMFSLSGIPPFVGFFAKIYVFQAALQAGHLWLVIIGVLSSAIAVFYSLKMLKNVYFEESLNKWSKTSPISIKLVGIVSAVFVVLMFIAPMPVYNYASKAAATLF